MGPRIRDLAAPSDPRIGGPAARAVAAGSTGLDPRIRRGPSGNPAGAPPPALPGAATPWWDPTARRHACTEDLPGEYHQQQANTVYHPGLGGRGEVHAIGGSLLSAADREAVELPLARFLEAYEVPNAALALLDGSGRLVHCAGLTNLALYQTIDQPPAWAGPHSSFRVGSVSKTLTAWAIMKLADLGIVDNMEVRLYEYVDLQRIPEAVERGLVGRDWIPGKRDGRDAGTSRDRITLKHLLTHRGGGFDDGYSKSKTRAGAVADVYPYVTYTKNGFRGVMDKNISSFQEEMAATNRATWPVTHDHMLRYFNMWPLAFEPGSHFCYSNLGYWMLGRVVESASCRGYESFVREALLRPLGMRDTRIGPDLSTDRGVGEMPVFGYHWPGGSGTQPSESQSYQTSSGSYTGNDLDDYEPYAERRLRLTDAPGGWISSAYDLALYARETFYRQSLFQHDVWYREMLQYQGATGQGQGMGYGWESGGWHGKGSWFKVGHVPGGAADVYFEGTSPRSRGLTMVVMYNRFNFTGNDAADKATDKAMRKLVVAAMQAMTVPTGGQDLFRVLPP